MTGEKRITVRSKPLSIVNGDDQGTKAVDIAICTKKGMDVRIRSDHMSLPDTECYFYVRLDHPWNRSDGSGDYDEIITDGDNFYLAFRPLGKQRLKWTEAVRQVVTHAIQKFVAELT